MGSAVSKIFDLIEAARPWQWYKNLLVALPLFFAGKLFELKALYLTVFGFSSLCLVSSANYLLNDICDLKADRLHPEKKKRPIASGRVGIVEAALASGAFLSASLVMAYFLDMEFLFSLAALFVLGQIYNLWLKREVLADVIAIGAGFVLRAGSGAYLLDVKISPWLVVGVFFLAVFLAVGKRHGEALLLGALGYRHRAALAFYSKELTSPLLVVSTSLLVVAYSLYSFFSEHRGIWITLPFGFYAMLRYFHLVVTGSPVARNPCRVFNDSKMVFAMALWFLLALLAIYVFS